MSSRARIRGELTLENAGMFVSMNAVYNGILKDQTGLFLREACTLLLKMHGMPLPDGKLSPEVADAMRLTDIISQWISRNTWRRIMTISGFRSMRCVCAMYATSGVLKLSLFLSVHFLNYRPTQILVPVAPAV